MKNMKNLLLTCCVFAAALSLAKAQVSKSDFVATTNALNTAITKNDVRHQTESLEKIDNMIHNEITYRTLNMKTIQIQSKQDSLEAIKELTKTKLDYEKATAEQPGPTPQSKAKKTKDLQDAEKEAAAAQQELKKASGEHQMFVNNKDNLAIEQKIRGDWAPLFIDPNVKANQNSIDNVLNQFAATLQ